MASPLEPIEISILISLPLRGGASLAELVVDAGLSPAELQRGLRQLQLRNLVDSYEEQSQYYRLTPLGRSTRRSLDSFRVDSLSGPAVMLDNRAPEELQAVKNHLDDELDRELGPVDPGAN
jgi:DNA-binding PadR family transcriptional regulator